MAAHDQAGGRETVEGGVVLRFPGDWVGPLEDLVPFGPSADRDTPNDAPDFWGEDSAVLQDAVEAPEPEHLPAVRTLQVRRRLLATGAVFAAVLFAVAAVLGGQTSSPPHVHGVTFAIASIPPLAPADAAIKKRPVRHRKATRPRRHPKSTQAAAASTAVTTVSPPVTTPSPTYHPPPATSSSSGASSSRSGGAFTLGGP